MTDRLTLLSRPECGLCETMLADLAEYARSHPLPSIDIVDVDSDAELARRYGLHIPVLLYQGQPVCRVTLDRQALARLLRIR